MSLFRVINNGSSLTAPFQVPLLTIQGDRSLEANTIELPTGAISPWEAISRSCGGYSNSANVNRSPLRLVSSNRDVPVLPPGSRRWRDVEVAGQSVTRIVNRTSGLCDTYFKRLESLLAQPSMKKLFPIASSLSRDRLEELKREWDAGGVDMRVFPSKVRKLCDSVVARMEGDVSTWRQIAMRIFIDGSDKLGMGLEMALEAFEQTDWTVLIRGNFRDTKDRYLSEPELAYLANNWRIALEEAKDLLTLDGVVDRDMDIDDVAERVALKVFTSNVDKKHLKNEAWKWVRFWSASYCSAKKLLKAENEASSQLAAVAAGRALSETPEGWEELPEKAIERIVLEEQGRVFLKARSLMKF